MTEEELAEVLKALERAKEQAMWDRYAPRPLQKSVTA